MARITVEDCFSIVPNRFDLCLIASNRAKSIISGSLTTFSQTEKPAVIALREISKGLLDMEKVRENIVESLKNSEIVDFSPVNDAVIEAITEESEEKPGTVLSSDMFMDENVDIDD